MASEPDTSFVASLVAEHHGDLYRYAYRLTGSTSDAEDLTQQTFLVAHRKIGQLRSTSSARGWLFAVLRSRFSRLCRKRVPTAATSLDLDIDALPDEVPEPNAIDRETLQSALNELTEPFRMVLLMYYFEECSYREIAERLALPAGTVMSRLSRAKRHLRSRLLESQLLPTGQGRIARADGKREL